MNLRLHLALLLCAMACHSCRGNRGDNSAVDCCLDVSHKVIPRRIVAACKSQDTSMGCRIPAIVFITKKNRKLCAPPDAKWVKRLWRKCSKPSLLQQ